MFEINTGKAQFNEIQRKGGFACYMSSAGISSLAVMLT